MTTDHCRALLEGLKAGQLLTASQVAELTAGQNFGDTVEALAANLVARRWLTDYQADEMLQGRAQGLVLGPYLLLDRLGQGGMGEVFKARHRLMNREVAMKFIRPEYLADKDALARFQREIQALSQVAHPNIVLAYDAAEMDGRMFLVMEYVEGTTLSSLVAVQGPLPWALASDFLRQAALGLQHAHERGLVHRDIKPGNLMLARPPGAADASGGGTVKVLDLGLALIRPPTTLPDSGSGATLTSVHTVMGTPDFMAPEQAVSTHQADIRADIYSLGCTLYFLLTGRPPFAEGTAMEKILLHQHSHPLSVRILRPDVPPALAAALAKMIAKRPQERYQTPAEAAAALAPFSQESPVTARIASATGLMPDLDETLVSASTDRTQRVDDAPVPARMVRRRVRFLAAALMVGLVCVGGVWFANRHGLFQSDQKKQDPGPEARGEYIVATGGQGTFATIAEALKKASQRERIRVRPGVYPETLLIDRDVEIVGDGEPGEVVIEAPDSTCLQVSADKAIIRNITIRGKSGAKGGEFNAVKIAHGRVLLEDCRITSATGSGLVILGVSASPTLRRCIIDGNTRAGLFVTRGAQPTIEACRINGNQVGVHVSEKGNPFLRDCKIEDNREFGVFLFQQGEGRIDEGCVLTRNKIGLGVQEEGSYLILQNCLIQANQTSGVIIQKGGKAKLFDCTVRNNGEFGLLLTDKGSNVVIESSKIQQNTTGVAVRSQAHGRIEECDLRENRAFALLISPGCDVVERKNQK